jgi:hypothetical protein
MTWFHRDIGEKARLSLTDFAELRTVDVFCTLRNRRSRHIQTLHSRALEINAHPAEIQYECTVNGDIHN